MTPAALERPMVEVLSALWLLAAQPASQPSRRSSEIGHAGPTDTMVSVGTRRLHVSRWSGEGAVTFVFEAGGGADGTSWGSVPQSVADRTGTPVIVYDRAGLGRSDGAPLDLTPYQEIDDLGTVLTSLGVGRVVLVGHSYGGLLALYHAATHPERIAGLVLVDPMNPDFVQRMGLAWMQATVPPAPSLTTRRDTMIVRMKRDFEDLVSRTAGALASIRVPLAVITAGQPWWGSPEAHQAWRASHEALVASAPDRDLVIAQKSRHGIPSTEPELIVEAVAQMLTRIGRS